MATFLALAAASARADDYQLGHGLDIGPLNIAGYSDVVARLPNQ